MYPFRGVWITTGDFIHEEKPCLFHKEMQTAEPYPHKDRLKNYHAEFTKTFHARPEGTYRIRVSADDYYKLYINGVYAGQGPRMGYVNHYYYNEYDITALLTAGENEIKVHVYYQGLINRVWVSGDCRMGMIADVYRDGIFLLGTDESWRCVRLLRYHQAETVGYETQYLEHMDFRLNRSEPVETVADAADDHQFYQDPAQSLKVYGMRHLPRWNGTSLRMDLAQEIAGTVRMQLNGEWGQRVCIRYGEELNEDGSVRFDMRCNCKYEEILTLSGEWDLFDGYDYKGFRYLEVVSEQPFQIRDFQVNVQHMLFRQRIDLKTEDPRLRDIWRLCVNTIRYSTQEAFLDCPTREKGQYLGDFTVSGLAYLYLTGDASMYRQTLYDFAATGEICPGLMADACCSFMQEIGDFSLMYPLQIWNYYCYTQDADTVRELLPTVDRMLEHFSRYEREDGLLVSVKDKWNLIDWPETCRDGYEPAIQRPIGDGICHNVINAYYIGAHMLRNRLGAALGEKENTEKTDGLIRAFHRAFYWEERGLYRDGEKTDHCSLHSNTLPAFFGFMPERAKETVGNFIIEKGFSCGVLFSYFVLMALIRMDKTKEAYTLLCGDSEHSWINMLRQGATTAFEAWGKEQKANTSLCHPWACAPVLICVQADGVFPEAKIYNL